MGITIYTIGVYGSTEESFFSSLLDCHVDVFCDVRQRRGMRGSTYAYVNSVRLQTRLAELDIRYFHLKQLAPPVEIRELQKRSDVKAGINKKNREILDPAYVNAYEETCLKHLDSTLLINQLNPRFGVAFFCVERSPSACHRSILASRIAQDLDTTVEHIYP